MILLVGSLLWETLQDAILGSFLFYMYVRTFETISGLINVQMTLSCLSLLSHRKV